MKKLSTIFLLLSLISACSKKNNTIEKVDCQYYETQSDNILQGKWSFTTSSQYGNITGNNKLEFSKNQIFLYKNDSIVESGQYVNGNCGYFVNIYLPSFGENGNLSLRFKDGTTHIYGSGDINNNPIDFDLRK